VSKACPLLLVFPGTSSTPLLPPSSARSRDRAPSSNCFRIVAYLDPQVGLQGTWEHDNKPRATRTHKTHHDLDLGEATTFPLIVYFGPLHGAHIQMAFLSRDSRVRVSKSRQPRLPRLWSPVTLRAHLGSKCGLKQSCSSRRELSNGIYHVICSQVNQVDSRLFLVGSQIDNLTPDLSFGHNLCFRCPNEQCEPILDI